ncbi:AIPR family protein [Psychrobacter sp. AOP22-C1-C5]|uniref:AIPR family protein n=1 Tax=Psychrobacter sp. AOP22-C1-C5 TaxID=3457716 RepID=UPI0040365639
MNNPADLQSYYSDLMNELDHSSTSQGNYKELLFIDKILPYIEEQGVVDNLEQYHFYKPGSRYGRIDGLGFNGDFNDADLDQLELVILINEFIHDDNIKSLTNSRIEQLKKAGVNFFNSSLKTQFIESLEESSDGYIAAKEIFQKYKRIESIKLIILTNAQISSRVADKKEIDEDLDIPLKIDIWDIKRIYDLESSQTKSEAIEIDLSEWGGPIPSLQATESDELTSYLCVVNGQTIADLYDEYGARLLEANVRSFLQFRGKINKGIRKTIKTEPEYFFSYNNGLTATASDVEYDKSKQIITKINNLQIVNGGQTTASLLMTQKKDKADLSKIQVQLKLNVVSDAKSDELISNISRYANSQNAIKDSDFFSNHPFHRTLEKLSRQILAPTSKERIKPTRWYYERARGSYLNAQSKLTDAGKKAFKSEHPKEQLIIKTDLAKIYLIFDKRPHDAIKGAQIAFNGFAQSIEKIWDNNPETINEYFFKELVAKFVIWQACKNAVYKREEFVGNTKATLTAYTIYILKALMDKQDLDFNYPKVWQEQAVNDFYYDQFIETSIKINALLNQLSEQTGKAVLSMAKSKETLIKVQSIIDKTDYFSLDMMFKTQLVSKSVIEEKRQDSAQQAKTVTKAVNSLIDLCNTPPAKWLALIKNAEDKGVLNETDKQVLSLVPNVLLGKSLKTPTDRQVELINKTLGKLEDKGVYLEVG